MPEGHTIHRHARLQRASLAGEEIRSWSPQRRFAAGAARLDGQTLLGIEALGKHLLYRWSSGDTLHVHLGLFGKFKMFKSDPPPPTEMTRLAMANGKAVVYLAGPTICELITPEEEDDLRARIGPDPLAEPRAGRRFASNLSRRRIPIGAALLDQQIVAGVGNVYRAEVLFKCGIAPQRPADRIDGSEASALWSTVKSELRAGEADGRIVTVRPNDVGVRARKDIPGEERLYVYKRGGLPCRRCGDMVLKTEIANRLMWWCPTCQPS
jgi:DNA-formamidopyrimidine glycosylase